MVKKTAVLPLWFTADEASFLLHALSSHTSRKEKSQSSAVVVSVLSETLYTAHSASTSAAV
jgi:predicted DNA-binding transcriptional regulator YafY